jgi:hypothetical protein
MKILTIKWAIGALASILFLAIVFLFILSFVYPRQGATFIIYAAVALLLIGILFVVVHFVERKNENYQFALSGLHNYLSISIKFVLTVYSGLALLVSFAFFLFSGNTSFLLNSGCFIAFTMIIILIELFIRILLPLAGIDQSA